MSEINNPQYPLNNQIDNSDYNIFGVLKADSGQFAEALDFFTKAIESEPENYVSYFNRASIRMRLGDITGARLDFKKCELLHRSSEN